MLRKSSFKNQAAVITDLGPDYQSPFYNPSNLETSYIKFTTQDAHNFVAGSKANILGLYHAQTRGATTASISLIQGTILSVPTPNTFIYLIPDTFVNSRTGINTFRFLNDNYYVNSNSLGSKTSWVGAYLNTEGWDLYSVNPLVTAYVSDGNLGAYKLSYGDTL